MKTNFGLDQIGTEASASTQLGVALLTGSPLLLGGLGCLLGGFLSDAYIRRTGNRTWGRRWVGVLGYGMAALSYVAAIFFHGNPLAVTACIALVGFSNDLTLGPSWATAQDIGRRYAATVSGCMNMIGNLGAALSNFTTGMILLKYTQAGQREEGYVLCLTLYAIAFGMGVIFWLLVDANKPIVED